MKPFNVTENGRTYKVYVRGSFQHSITSEKKLRKALNAAAVRVYGENAIKGKSIWDLDSLIGICSNKVPVE